MSPPFRYLDIRCPARVFKRRTVDFRRAADDSARKRLYSTLKPVLSQITKNKLKQLKPRKKQSHTFFSYILPQTVILKQEKSLTTLFRNRQISPQP
jgi:hypothetical protein